MIPLLKILKRLRIFPQALTVHYFNFMSEEEYNSIIEVMRQYKDIDKKPQIGIFGYSPQKDELIDVYLQDFDSVELHPCGKRISTKIHKKVWEKNYYKARAKNDKERLAYYEQDYAWIPRGRVNFNEKENQI